jgi:hypothetical protein
MPRVRNRTENVNTSSSGAIARPPNIRMVRPRSRNPARAAPVTDNRKAAADRHQQHDDARMLISRIEPKVL